MLQEEEGVGRALLLLSLLALLALQMLIPEVLAEAQEGAAGGGGWRWARGAGARFRLHSGSESDVAPVAQ